MKVFNTMLFAFFAVMMSAPTTSSALDLDVSGSVATSYGSEYRGREVTDGWGAEYDLRLDVGTNVVPFFVSVEGMSTALNRADTTARTDVGVGVSFGGLDVSLHRVINPLVIYPENYNELRAAYGVTFFDNLNLTGEVGQVVLSSVSKDTFARLGVECSDCVGVDGLHFGVVGLVYNYRNTYIDGFALSSTKFNNANFYVLADMPLNVQFFSDYSLGGKLVDGSNLGDTVSAGFRYNF